MKQRKGKWSGRNRVEKKGTVGVKWGEVPRGVFLRQVLCLNDYERACCPSTLPCRISFCFTRAHQ